MAERRRHIVFRDQVRPSRLHGRAPAQTGLPLHGVLVSDNVSAGPGPPTRRLLHARRGQRSGPPRRREQVRKCRSTEASLLVVVHGVLGQRRDAHEHRVVVCQLAPKPSRTPGLLVGWRRRGRRRVDGRHQPRSRGRQRATRRPATAYPEAHCVSSVDTGDVSVLLVGVLPERGKLLEDQLVKVSERVVSPVLDHSVSVVPARRPPSPTAPLVVAQAAGSGWRSVTIQRRPPHHHHVGDIIGVMLMGSGLLLLLRYP